MKPHKNYLLAIVRAIAFPLWIFVMLVAFYLTKIVKSSAHTNVPHLFHRGACIILGLRATFSGVESDITPTLYVSNHVSYLDILVLGRIKAFYIAKSEVASWPVLGTLARFQNTLFIERKAGRAKHQLDVMRDHLQNGRNLILFPEGTSTNGTVVETFKSSLFASASPQDEDSYKVAVQPISITYTHHVGQKMDQAMRDYYAWYATMPFGSHFLALLALKNVDVKVHFHPVTYVDNFENRKECSDYCQRIVAEKISEFIS